HFAVLACRSCPPGPMLFPYTTLFRSVFHHFVLLFAFLQAAAPNQRPVSCFFQYTGRDSIRQEFRVCSTQNTFQRPDPPPCRPEKVRTEAFFGPFWGHGGAKAQKGPRPAGRGRKRGPKAGLVCGRPGTSPEPLQLEQPHLAVDLLDHPVGD